MQAFRMEGPLCPHGGSQRRAFQGDQEKVVQAISLKPRNEKGSRVCFQTFRMRVLDMFDRKRGMFPKVGCSFSGLLGSEPLKGAALKLFQHTRLPFWMAS